MYVGKMYVDPNSFSMHKDLGDVLALPLTDSDVIVSGYPKSGTNWVQIMIANLWDDWTTTQNTYRRVPNLAGCDRDDYQGYHACAEAESPRLMKSHLHREALPTAWPAHGKVIHVTRDPRDVCVSQYHMLKTNSVVHPDDPDSETDWEVWVDRFVAGRITCGSYLDSTIGWHEFDHENLLKVHYEDFKQEPAKFLRSVVEFLERDADDARIEKVVEDTHPRNMRNNEALRAQINVPDGLDSDERPFIRTGGFGGWREAFSAEQLAKVENGVLRPMIDAGITRYEI